ncbi:MAG: hypothetical protein LBB38_01675 [Puniceicoccales bacterium]|jgi:hypothetical protein|nr:hypothetical protein [Puniceicoccales bacterium]
MDVYYQLMALGQCGSEHEKNYELDTLLLIAEGHNVTWVRARGAKILSNHTEVLFNGAEVLLQFLRDGGPDAERRQSIVDLRIAIVAYLAAAPETFRDMKISHLIFSVKRRIGDLIKDVRPADAS